MKYLWIFDQDMLWALCFLTGWLWAGGGSGPKLFRKAGVILAISASAYTMGVSLKICLLTAGLFSAAITIPYGSGLHKILAKLRAEWAYFPAVYVIGAVYAAALMPLCNFRGAWITYGIMTAVTGIVFGTMTLGSQKIDWPKWKFCEMALGLCLGLMTSLLIR